MHLSVDSSASPAPSPTPPPSWKFRFQLWGEGHVPACNHTTESTVSQPEQLLIMPGVQPTASGSCSAATWSFPMWIIPDIAEPVRFTQDSTFARHRPADTGGRPRGQANMSPCGGSYKNTKPFARHRKTQTDVLARRERNLPPCWNSVFLWRKHVLGSNAASSLLIRRSVLHW